MATSHIRLEPLRADQPHKVVEQAQSYLVSVSSEERLQLRLVEQTQQPRDESRPPVESRWWESNRWWENPTDSDSDSD